MRPKIKICGVREVTQAQTLLDMGVDYIGLLFHEASPRSLQHHEASAFAPLAPYCVPVFVDQNEEAMLAILHATNATTIQCHGLAAKQAQRQLAYTYRRIFVLSCLNALPPYQTLLTDYQLEPERDILLFDSIHVVADLQSILNAYKSFPTYLAGRLDHRTLPNIVKQYQPDGVDMASQVETQPGIKDLGMIEKLLKQLNNGV